MKMNATNLHNSSSSVKRAFQKSRKEKMKYNSNRVNQRFNMDNSTQNLKSLDNNDETKVLAKKDFETAIKSISNELESLPSKVLHHPANDLASLTLSAAITVNHACEKLSRLKTDSFIPNSARINFVIQGSKMVCSKN